MFEQFVPLVAGIFGSSITLVSVWFNNKSNYKRLEAQLEHEMRMKNEEVRRDRKEEAYILVDKFFRHVSSGYMTLTRVMEGKIDYNQYLDLQIDQKINFDPYRLSMLIHLYFEPLKKVYEEANSISGKLNSLEQAYKKEYRRGRGREKGAEYADLIWGLLDQLNEKSKELQNKIIHTI